jgi:drug/metabolite transporter (DMT)-like permease
MELMGIALGGGIAVLWGMADSIATLSTRCLTVFTTAFISHLSGLLTLSVLYLLLLQFYPSSTFILSPGGVLIGLFTGTLTVIGYLSLYRALSLGPVAITSPLSSTSAVVTVVLSMFILQEKFTFLDGIAIVVVIVGGLLASMDMRGVYQFLTQKGGNPFPSRGIRWACITPLAFGLVDIGIGASSPLHGWFGPVFLTFFFSTIMLALLSIWGGFFRKKDRSFSFSFQIVLENRRGILFAVGAGILECFAVLTFGIATQAVKPGMIAVISSNYSLVAIWFGVFILREQLTLNQKLGIGIVLGGLTCLALLQL